MTTKKELVIEALSHIRDFDSIKQLEIIIDLKKDGTIKSFKPMYKGKKYTKEKWCFNTVSAAIRCNPYDDDEPFMYSGILNIENIKSLKVIAK